MKSIFTRKNIFIVALVLLFVPSLFAQTDSTPVGEWCENKVGNSEFFLDISDSEIKYIEKKSEDFIIFNYHVEGDTQPKIVIDSFRKDSTLEFDKINKELFTHLTKISTTIPYTRDGDKMILLLKTEKGKEHKIKLVTREKKQAYADGLKTAGAVGLALIVGVAAYEAWDYIKGKADMQDIADECLKASLAI